MPYLKLVDAPAIEPITLDAAKLRLRVDSVDDDERIKTHIKEAREWVEARIQKKIAEATWEMGLDAFPSSGIALTISPVLRIMSIKYDDLNLAAQTMLSSNYFLNDVTVFPTTSWPSAYDRQNSVRVRFTAGYDDPTLIPFPVIAAMHLKIQELYDGDDMDVAIHRLLTNYYTMVA